MDRVTTVTTPIAAASGAATTLGCAAAPASVLEVGVGIDAGGAVAVHHASLPADTPARIVTGLPIA